MYRLIVVGHDGSHTADDAVDLALRLRRPGDGRVVLVRVLPSLPGPPAALGRGTRHPHERARAELGRAAARVPRGVPAETLVVDAASPARGLHAVATAQGADLLVVGATHRGAAARAARRETARRLLRGAPSAVAVAVGRPPAAPCVLVAYDGSAAADRALDAAYALVVELGGSVVLCDVLDPGTPVASARHRAARRHLAEAAARAPRHLSVEQRLLHGEPVQRLLDETRVGVDLLITGSRRRGLVRALLQGSVSGDLLATSPVPVLVPADVPTPGPQTAGGVRPR